LFIYHILSGKIVVFVVNKSGLQEAQQTLPGGVPSNDPSLPDLTTPLYLLVNANTASAAEVLSAALKVISDKHSL
jgi:C-terminal processing protease CtpA/Prc